VIQALERARRGIRKHGLGGAVGQAWKRTRNRVYLRTEHVWYELPLALARPSKTLPGGFRLGRATEGELDALEQLPTVPPDEARRRLHDGAELWLVTENDRPAFACWIFHAKMPVLAARDGWIDVPPEAVCLEDSVTSPEFRGRGIAPGAWSEIADALREAGIARMVTQVERSNVPSRKAVQKAAFVEVARVAFERTGPRTRVAVSGDGDLASYLWNELDTNGRRRREPRRSLWLRPDRQTRGT
jgi:GNAT superfamily N-acetyltransferase